MRIRRFTTGILGVASCFVLTACGAKTPQMLDVHEVFARAVFHVALSEHVRFIGTGSFLEIINGEEKHHNFSGSVLLSPARGMWQIFPVASGGVIIGGSRRFTPHKEEIEGLLRDTVIESGSLRQFGRDNDVCQLHVRMKSASGFTLRGMIDIDAKSGIPKAVRWIATNDVFSLEMSAQISFPDFVHTLTASGSAIPFEGDAIFDMFLQN